VQPPHGVGVGVGEELEGLLQRLEVLGGEQHGGGLAVHGHVHALMLAADAGDQHGQVSFGVGQGHRRHGQQNDQNCGAGPASTWRVGARRISYASTTRPTYDQQTTFDARR
jgi:hypothetical protein